MNSYLLESEKGRMIVEDEKIDGSSEIKGRGTINYD